MGRLRDKFTGTIRPAEGSTPVPLPDLRAALRALDVPFTVRAPRLDEKADLVAEWSTPHRVRLRIRMRFDAGRGEVRVLEERWERSGVLGNRRYGRGPGRVVVWSAGERFDSGEMRGALTGVVVGAGWVWRGVLVGW
ncbi:hypothetical protein [Streptomyces acidiscabies]|uniref:Uncharacterized protein n=2 Tax=Streptomyces acidiscabies TaxID=42234 RepID=A0AAP6BAB3_9ACTN|nr:hypothetical protein [Streptomyces acidiscabies]MBZ3914321.1 hypothetical protein [Streptomyces acidiscabies]MDX2960955.1 hypothetical protein [Streptomyces acidiscabies]MDX3017012.1 hypothetical protein [Streptomyces acidiscabies]MDX3788963.1 hypothetical protein [Streptomyces acidiscabies]